MLIKSRINSKSLLKASLVIQSSLLCLWACDSSNYEKFEGATQGTTYHITAELPAVVDKSVVEKNITQRLMEVDKSLSTYRKDSEITQFNQSEVKHEMVVSQDFIDVLDVSRDVYKKSGKVFNPTIKPLVDLWGFGAQVSVASMQSTPSESSINTAKKYMHFDDVINNGTKIHKRSLLSVDFNGVAQGYTVDALKAVLANYHIKNYMIEVGGELATKGISARGDAWRIGIEQPEDMMSGGAKTFTALALNDAHVATSGDYRSYYEIEGQRFSHTIDPRTGKPINHQLASVTVLAESAAHADAWSTSLMVLGEKDGFLLAEKLHIPAYFIYRDKGTFSFIATKAMQTYLRH